MHSTVQVDAMDYKSRVFTLALLAASHIFFFLFSTAKKLRDRYMSPVKMHKF